MLCSETGSQEVVHIPGMSVADAEQIAPALRVVRGTDHGNGEICIPLTNGFFDRIRIALTIYHEKRKKKMVN